MHFDYLWRLLQPLGVYGAEGYNIGELKALGVAMDAAQEQLEEYHKEIHHGTALGDGLERAEQLFPMLAATDTVSRKKALGVLFAVGGRWGTKVALEETLGACGIPVIITEKSTKFHCLVTMTKKLVITDDPVFLFRVVESILPCHMVAEVAVTYKDMRTGSTVSEQMGLADFLERTQAQWEARLGSIE